MTKEDVVHILTKERFTDYVEIYNPKKINLFDYYCNHDLQKLKDFEYYFSIVRTNIEKINRE